MWMADMPTMFVTDNGESGFGTEREHEKRRPQPSMYLTHSQNGNRRDKQ